MRFAKSPALLVGLLAAMPLLPAQTTEWKLPNGLEVVHVQRPSLKVIASLVTVNVGSKDETAETSGLSHLLEHMAFDGTPKRTRAEINEGSKRYGGYVNATTRTSFTSYISIFPADFAELSLDLQSDMLFNSTIPEQELEKERKVVIEEMKRDRDSRANLAAEYHDEQLFAGTPYARPVLGTESTISAVPRKTVFDYYKRHYIPARMRTLIVSPFQDAEVRRMVDATFGKASAVKAYPASAPSWEFPKETAIRYREESVPSAFLHVSLPAPAMGDPDYLAFDLLTRYLAEGGNSPLQRAVRMGKPPLADSLSASLEAENNFSVWKFSAITQPASIPDLLETLRRSLQSAAVNGIPEEDLARLQRQILAQEAISSEQLQYYGFFKAPLINAQGFQFAMTYPQRLCAVTRQELRRAADRFLSKPVFFATAFVPKGKVPAEERATEAHQWRKDILPNGLTLIAQGSDESDVFAVCVLTRQRSALEPPETDGLSDFVHRMLLRGTNARPAEAIQKELDRLAAQVQYVDNPFIPFDDHYTNNRFTFFRLEVLDELRRPALDLLSEIYSQSNFPEAEVEKVRQELVRLQMREMDNSAKRASQRYREILLAGTPFARAILGKSEAIGKTTRAQLLEHYQKLYAPDNLVVLAAGKGTTDSVMRDVKARFEGLKGTSPAVVAAAPAPRSSFQTEHIKADKQQTQFSAGGLTPGWKSSDGAALRVLNAILSERLAVELRETQGLAYSVTADLQQEADYGWIEIRMGTRAEAAEQARQGILAVVRKLADGEISAAERERAINGLWGSTLRTRLPRIGQTFYRGLDEIRAAGYNAEESLLKALQSVAIEDLRRVAAVVLDTEHWILISLGR